MLVFAALAAAAIAGAVRAVIRRSMPSTAATAASQDLRPRFDTV
jgi:hypothetical protein